MKTESEIAAYLGENTYHYSNPPAYVEIEGVRTTYPYQWIESAPRDQPLYLTRDQLTSHAAIRNFYTPETLPSEWVEFIQGVDELRTDKGCDSPFNLIAAVECLLDEDPLAGELKIPHLPVLPEGGNDFRDMVPVIDIVHRVLSNPVLRQRLTEISSIQLPDLQFMEVSPRDVGDVLRHFGINSGYLLELGCGAGNKTLELQKHTDLKTIAIDRLFHPKYYDEFWHQRNPNISYAMADFMESLPFPYGSIDAVTMEHVVMHVNQYGLRRGLEQSKRVLRPGGLLFIGPETGGYSSNWCVFQKQEHEGVDYLVQLDTSFLRERWSKH